VVAEPQAHRRNDDGFAIPMALRWGPQFVIIYNDGYLPILGAKHPERSAHGFAKFWPEVQDQLGSLHHGSLVRQTPGDVRRGHAAAHPPRRHGMEDAYFT
jgi:hypothetical protein